MKVVLLRFLETLGNRAPARRREDRRERAFRDADEASLDDPAQPPSMAARQRAPDPPVEPGWTRMGRESAFPARGERRAAARGAGGGRGRDGRGRRAGGGGRRAGGGGRRAGGTGARGGGAANGGGRGTGAGGSAQGGGTGGRWTRQAAYAARPTRRGPKLRQGAVPSAPTPCKHDSNGHGQKATVSPVFRLEGALRLRAAADVRTKLLVEGEGGFSIPKWE